ncbi:response regulator [Vibrio sp. RE88]|uniref:response regulator n=1 Tax=Vibrio sp. RE88 TaxID=2607610 RepID=UPI0014935DE2|nr:response regulator [Vibrio sp. RE88]NOH62794.1 response regulator [Vibrio sp. RE88]
MKKSILIVEDDQLLLSSIKRIFPSSKFDVYAACDSERGIDISEIFEIDVVIIDYLLPGLSGIEAISHFRKSNPNIVVILITAYATVDTVISAMHHGANDVIVKPFTANKVLLTVEKYLEKKKFTICPSSAEKNKIFSALSNETRRQVLYALTKASSMKFSELFNVISIDDHTKLNFHIQSLKKSGLIKQDNQKRYTLTAEATSFLNHTLVKDSLL